VNFHHLYDPSNMQASRGAQKFIARYRKVKGKFCGRKQVVKENCVAIDGLREPRGEEQVFAHRVENVTVRQRGVGCSLPSNTKEKRKLSFTKAANRLAS
jgi:hypothetical protein